MLLPSIWSAVLIFKWFLWSIVQLYIVIHISLKLDFSRFMYYRWTKFGCIAILLYKLTHFNWSPRLIRINVRRIDRISFWQTNQYTFNRLLYKFSVFVHLIHRSEANTWLEKNRFMLIPQDDQLKKTVFLSYNDSDQFIENCGFVAIYVIYVYLALNYWCRVYTLYRFLSVRCMHANIKDSSLKMIRRSRDRETGEHYASNSIRYQ